MGKVNFNATEFFNIKEIFYNSVEKYGDNIAFTIKHIIDNNAEYENISYKKMLQDVNELGASFYKNGFKDYRVAIIGKNRYEWVLTHITNMLGNMVSVPLDKDLQYEELENSLIRSKADVIVFDIKLTELMIKIKNANNTNIKHFICMSDTEDFEKISDYREEGKKLFESNSKEYNDYINSEIDNNKMSILLFTSGTTSKSKAVMLSQRNIASNIYAMQQTEDIRTTDTNIAFLPFHHIFGSTCLIVMLSYGVKTVFPDGLRYIKQNLNEYKVTLFVGVPALVEAMYRTIMKEIEKQGKTKLINIATKISNFLLKLHIDLRRKIFKQVIDALGGGLRMIISGGAPADAKISKRFNDLGVVVVQGYGLSETGPVIAAENFKQMRNGSVGPAMNNDIIEVDNPDEDGIGELKVKGPNVMLGYYEMPELTSEVLKDGWFYTGDLGYIDKDGYVFITGRNKNLIVLKNGKKVFPEELEAVLCREEIIQECMVFGLQDEKDPLDVMVAVKVVYNKEYVEKNYKDVSFEELRDVIWNKIKDINTTFPKYKHIKKLLLTDKELIKTTTMKIKRHEELKIIMDELKSNKD